MRPNAIDLAETNARRVFIGRDRNQNWIVQEEDGLWGGMFVSFPEALAYAKHEDAAHAHPIVLATWPIELFFAA